MDGYNVEAILPPGSPGYTAQQLHNGAAPRLQLMLRTLLADRFKLVLRREMREMPVYNLVVVSEGKVKPSTDEQNAGVRQGDPMLVMLGTTMSRLAGTLQVYMGRPVIDRTNRAGLFDIRLTFPGMGGLSVRDREAEQRRQLPARLQEQLGLTLEPARAPVEVLVIESVERPSEN